MALINDTIDQLSYEVGEASGYVDGSRTGYEYGYHDCMLDLVKRHNLITRRRTRKIKQLLYLPARGQSQFSFEILYAIVTIIVGVENNLVKGDAINVN